MLNLSPQSSESVNAFVSQSFPLTSANTIPGKLEHAPDRASHCGNMALVLV